ncbi:ABC transporter substrate-binding protein [Neisseria zalophi]|uniref:Oligopeptide ABC transporter substrate-binding protein OppA n=1 Tax=Neisseria zalophi TaxID=640030 RepID=A0A5J6PSY2_9NEIS|nr:ABC transporter substrate-binding protein [Neisseria zalophi]QEY25466.1 oligopeptide ABC transporter substrate-binding protein OppA [Neisseria zalophi]
MERTLFRKSTVLLATLAAFGLAACGGGDESANSNTQTAQSSEPAEQQEVVIGNGAEPESLDPQKVSGVPEANILRQMLVGLTTTDNDGNTVAGMAEKWESADNKVWTFHLRDAQWSNGDPVTADDFVYSMRRLTDPATASPYASYLADAKVANAAAIIEGKAKPETLGVKALDPKTLEITLTEPVPYFPDMLIHTSVKPVHAKTVEQFGNKWTSPENIVVNGPYKLKDWVVNSRIVLERNPNYFDDAATSVNQITLLPISSPPTDVSRFQAGESDFTYNDIPSEQFQSLKRDMGDQMKVSPYLCTYYYEFNHTKPPFDNAKVRKALQLALDRETLAEKVVGRGETAAYQFTPPATQGMPTFTPEWQQQDKAQRIATAKQLLNEAGYDEAHPLTFELLYNTNENHKKNAVAAAALWKEALGFVNVDLVNQEWKTYLDTRRDQRFQMARGGWCADYNEGSAFLNIFKSDNSSNYGKYNSPEFDSLMMKTLANDVSPEARGELYRQAEAVLDKDAATIFVYHYVNGRLVKPHVDGYSLKDPLDNWQVKNWKILKH